MNLSRRDFIKMAGAALLSPALMDIPDEAPPPHPTGLGRVTADWIWAYDRPQPGRNKLEVLPQDKLLTIRESVYAEGLLAHNHVWHRTGPGWVYSPWVQPVEERFNQPIPYVPPEGFWAQVTLPYIELRTQPNDAARHLYRLYYSSVHLVTACLQDEQGGWWYRLRDDQYPARHEFVRAEGLRWVSPGEMLPISPHIEDKIIEVNLQSQMVYAYEEGRLAFSARCATGAAFHVSGLGRVNFGTPRGAHQVIRKCPSRHMSGGRGRSDFYDLPGVPFCTYFTGSGVAIHGTYWHNDYGHQRSHGCVNVLAEEALWFYRWAQPPADYNDVELMVEGGGTPILVT